MDEKEVVRERYKVGEYIFFEGDIDYHFYIVEEGQVQIFTKDTQGKRLDIVTVNKSESFGEFAFLERKPRSASAQALTEAVVVRISEKGYQQLLSELPTWANAMLQSFAGRIRHMNEVLSKLSGPGRS
jgi:CRP/FNR family cyclic AMP-dependent transcriptional regulator